MWMMGYTDGGDPFSGRKLRTIVPRPTLGRIHGSDLISFNHHLAAMAEQNKRTDFSPHQVVVSSRWNPTPEQLEALEELYRRGTRTPSSEEIQHITAQLRKFGKIEGKNVFYWFQNHKARERQKRRRQLASNDSDHEPPAANNNAVENAETKEEESGANNGTSLEGEGTKNWAHSTNCSNLAEKTGVSARGAAAESCRVADGWAHFDEQEEFRQRKNLEPNATWHMMMPPFSSPSSSSPSCNLVISNSSAGSTIHSAVSSTTFPAQGTTHHATGEVVIRGTPQYNFFNRDDHLLHQDSQEEHQTLQLFPLKNDEGRDREKESERSVLEAMDSNTMTTPYKYFEFLPLKN